ncbi:GDSL esterase/lipase At5g03610 isoform X2 [Spinacia oleracea]|uniref:GDSL esterase/lipase At5g03610 isoform X2 n=1 Tax=Spinacia oleracea TaxID=3562 RepID=A0A9R0HSB4_SPIOL|nr:GDSL esterase/lipase At5g03610-like isoform X2 [Spinacia oleracea]
MAPGQKLLFTFFLCSSSFLLTGVEVVEGSSRHHHQHHHHVKHNGVDTKKLFVFGDSYADTGNNRISNGDSWKLPYGITFPGKPSGRFSDGRVFTDFLARYLGLKSPVAYKFRRFGGKHLKYGMNFAFGGTGVFDTTAPYPNMTTQIDFFERLLNESVFTPFDLETSIAHVSLVGNDYSAYLSRGGSVQGLQTFIPQVVNELVVDIKRIYKLGVKKISVTALQPLGCLPRSTIQNSFQRCNDTFNQAVIFHNTLLQQAVTNLNNNHTHGSPIVIIDLYNAFLSVIQQNATNQQGSSKFANPMRPCCRGISPAYYCGNVDQNGNNMYTVCQHPNNYFFWDDSHPTQAGWEALTTALQPNLDSLQR